MSTAHEYVFPAIRGLQAGREYYVSMCPMSLIPKIFLFDEEEVPPEVRAQRSINKSRIPAITKYLVDNPENYIFSALTASIDGDVEFQPFSDSPKENQLGLLHIPMSSRFIVNDGQHRRAAIEEALKKCTIIREETISVVFFVDSGLIRAQQMFADLNRYAVRPSNSLGILYDHRDPINNSVSLMVLNSTFYKSMTDRHKSSLVKRAKELFTLSALRSATQELIRGLEFEDATHYDKIINDFWRELSKIIKEWREVYDGKLTAFDVRERYIHSYAVTLKALGRVGRHLFNHDQDDWLKKLSTLNKIDWSRNNRVWEGHPLTNGSIRHSEKMVTLTAMQIKKILGLNLTEQEQAAEHELQ